MLGIAVSMTAAVWHSGFKVVVSSLVVVAMVLPVVVLLVVGEVVDVGTVLQIICDMIYGTCVLKFIMQCPIGVDIPRINTTNTTGILAMICAREGFVIAWPTSSLKWERPTVSHCRKRLKLYTTMNS